MVDAWQAEKLLSGVWVNGSRLPSDSQTGFRVMVAKSSGSSSILVTPVTGPAVTLNADGMTAYTQALFALQELVDSKVRSATQTISVSTTYQQIEAAVAALDA